jgi:molecular chaperone DnaK
MSKLAIGIDLGTTNSVLAVINPAGKPEIVASRSGERLTPSAVYFEDDRHSILVGAEAQDSARKNTTRVVKNVKRFMGDADWRKEIDGKAYTAVDISAMILKKVRQEAEEELGPIESAVITVPAYFDEVRRKATMDAARKAGLEVLRIINEPTAAALAYAVAGRVKGNVLVYDFGGGTFDVSIVNIKSSEDITVITSEGDNRLGGCDLDMELARHFDELFYKEKGLRLLDDGTAEFNTLEEAQTVKHKLSRISEAPAFVRAGKESDTFEIERSLFEKKIKTHVTQTKMAVENALSEAGLAVDEIDAVLLVGGSTRIPAIQQMLEKKFGQKPLKQVNPDEAVALGAAIQAGIILQQRGLLDLPDNAGATFDRMRVQDITNMSYGTIYLGEAHGREDQLRNDVIIPKNTPIPFSQTNSYYTQIDDQREVLFRVTEGEGDDPEFVQIVESHSFELPPGRPAGREVRITYSYDADQRMKCEILDVESGRTESFLGVDNSSKMPKSPAIPDAGEIDFDDLKI